MFSLDHNTLDEHRKSSVSIISGTPSVDRSNAAVDLMRSDSCPSNHGQRSKRSALRKDARNNEEIEGLLAEDNTSPARYPQPISTGSTYGPRGSGGSSGLVDYYTIAEREPTGETEPASKSSTFSTDLLPAYNAHENDEAAVFRQQPEHDYAELRHSTPSDGDFDANSSIVLSPKRFRWPQLPAPRGSNKIRTKPRLQEIRLNDLRTSAPSTANNTSGLKTENDHNTFGLPTGSDHQCQFNDATRIPPRDSGLTNCRNWSPSNAQITTGTRVETNANNLSPSSAVTSHDGTGNTVVATAPSKVDHLGNVVVPESRDGLLDDSTIVLGGRLDSLLEDSRIAFIDDFD